MSIQELTQEDLSVARELLLSVSGILAQASGAEIRVARHLVEHVALRLSQMNEGDIALRIA